MDVRIPPRIPWTRSLTVRIAAALLLLFSVAAATVGLTVYELALRKHDYVILNLAGQLRVLAQGLVRQAVDYRRQSLEHTFTPAQREELFRTAFRAGMEQFGTIVAALRARELTPEITGRSAPLRCNWDSQSIAQLNRTAIAWDDLSRGVMTAAGGSAGAPDLEAVSAYLLQNEDYLKEISAKLARSFQVMMEGKLALIVHLNEALLGVALAVVAVLLILLYHGIARPLGVTVAGMARVAQGDFAHLIPVRSGDELGRMAHAFNHLSGRLAALFRLTRRINEATTLDDTLHAVFDEFRGLLPVDWLGLLVRGHDGALVLERLYSDGAGRLKEGDLFAAGPAVEEAVTSGRPLHLAGLEAAGGEGLARAVAEEGRRSLLLFPLDGGGRRDSVLLFAHRDPAAYTAEHLELLGNIAAQVGQGFAKTVVTENLVVSAVSGLAKLAESRDPETGDHLVRMALYSAILAEELNREGPHCGTLPPAAVRDIHRFAPMHDIGKVGIADGILLKPGRLTAEERSEMERHPAIGGEVLRRCEEQVSAAGRSVFRTGIEIAECHHEKFDGSGYPNGLRGEAIPLSARIVAVADVFDALTSKRPYKEAWPVERALAVVEQDAGSHFDPAVAAAMRRALPRVMEVYERLKHV